MSTNPLNYYLNTILSPKLENTKERKQRKSLNNNLHKEPESSLSCIYQRRRKKIFLHLVPLTAQQKLSSIWLVLLVILVKLLYLLQSD